MVKVRIRERNFDVSDELRAYTERKLGFELARFGARVARVVVRFSEQDDGEVRPDRRCHIDVGLRSRSARVEEAHADLFVAVDRATERLIRSVVRVLEREREWVALARRPLGAGM